MRYRRIDPEIVEAWQYQGGAAYPEGAERVLARVAAHAVIFTITPEDRAVRARLGIPYPDDQVEVDYLYWFDAGANQRCYAGGWIVWDEDGGLTAWDPELFAATFAPIEEDN